VSYPWEVSVANPLPGPFASVGMSPTDVVEEPEQDPAPSEGPARSNPKDGPGTHYIDPAFRNELRKIRNFEVKFSFRWNFWVIVPSSTDTVNKASRLRGCLFGGLRARSPFSPSKNHHGNLSYL